MMVIGECFMMVMDDYRG